MITKILAQPRSTTAAERSRWSRVAVHLGAGLRLRRRLESLANARGCSPSTVANQIASIFDKLGVSCRVELAVALSS